MNYKRLHEEIGLCQQEGKKTQGIDLIALNTDARHLRKTKAHNKILLGENLTRGLGSGGDPRVGEASAMESEQEIVNYARGKKAMYCRRSISYRVFYTILARICA